MALGRLVFRVHAIQRMFEWRVSEQDVRHVLETGQVIREYPHDRPYPSRLVLGWVGSRPLHIVAAANPPAAETIVITVYEPNPARWDADYRRKKP